MQKVLVSTISDKKDMISDVLSLIDFLRRHWTEFAVKSAMFKFDGTRIEGDDFIEVERIPATDNKDIWFYRVKEKHGYEFIYMSVIPSLSIDYGQLKNTKNP